MTDRPRRRSLSAQLHEIDRLIIEQGDRARSIKGFGAGSRKAEAEEHLLRMEEIRETILRAMDAEGAAS